MILRVRKFIKHLDLADINNMCLNIIITLFIRVKIRPSCSKKVRMIKFVVYCTCVKFHCYKNGQIYHRCFMYCHIFKRTSIYMQQVSKLFKNILLYLFVFLKQHSTKNNMNKLMFLKRL